MDIMQDFKEKIWASLTADTNYCILISLSVAVMVYGY